MQYKHVDLSYDGFVLKTTALITKITLFIPT